METMAYCGSRYRCRCHDAVICLYSRDLARWYQQDRHSSKNLSSRKCTPNNIPRRVGPREEIPELCKYKTYRGRTYLKKLYFEVQVV